MVLATKGYAIYSPAKESIYKGSHQECLKELDRLQEDSSSYLDYYVDRIPSDIEEFELREDPNERNINYED